MFELASVINAMERKAIRSIHLTVIIVCVTLLICYGVGLYFDRPYLMPAVALLWIVERGFRWIIMEVQS